MCNAFEPPVPGNPSRIAMELAVQSIEQDFRRVVETLARALETAEHSDSLVTERVQSMMEFAERGMALSRQLLDAIAVDQD